MIFILAAAILDNCSMSSSSSLLLLPLTHCAASVLCPEDPFKTNLTMLFLLKTSPALSRPTTSQMFQFLAIQYFLYYCTFVYNRAQEIFLSPHAILINLSVLKFHFSPISWERKPLTSSLGQISSLGALTSIRGSVRVLRWLFEST